MDYDGARARDARRGKTAAQGVGEEIGAKTHSLPPGVDREARDQQQGHPVRLPLARLRAGQNRPMLLGCGDRVIAGHPLRLVARADHIGSRREPLAGQRPLTQPVVQRLMGLARKVGNQMIGTQRAGAVTDSSGI